MSPGAARAQYLSALGITVWRDRAAEPLLPASENHADETPAATRPTERQQAHQKPPAHVPEKHVAATAGRSPAVPEDKRAAPVLDIPSMDWPTLAGAVARCQQCPLHSGRQRTVFGTGAQRADWLLIGEAPGAEEDRLGEPFVGPAGMLLNAMLAATGRSRESVYIANILKCRPAGNRDPRAEEAEACSAYLDRQIALVQPAIIIALGRIAAQRLLGTESPLGRLRGRPHEFQRGGRTIPLVVTYHPAYLLRSPAQKGKSWQDLQLAMRLTGEASR